MQYGWLFVFIWFWLFSYILNEGWFLIHNDVLRSDWEFLLDQPDLLYRNLNFLLMSFLILRRGELVFGQLIIELGFQIVL